MHLQEKNGFLRLKQIVGDPNTVPPIPAIIPISKSAWWAGVRSQKFPKPIKIGPRTTAWRAQDIRELVERLSSDGGAQ